MRELYARYALEEMPRLLSLLNRDSSSPTYGSFYRVHWHDKVTDVESAHVQLATLALVLAYSRPFPHNHYFRNRKIRQWCKASMEYWMRIQNGDGSFNEHYPNEHSFGATAWSLQAILQSHELLQDELTPQESDMLVDAEVKAAKWLVKNDEYATLANHLAIAAFTLAKASELCGVASFAGGAKRKLDKLFSLQSADGWFLEYDGPDLGYLTTTISFLAKYFQINPQESILKRLEKAINFASYFVFPDGTYGGVIGSRNTTHFSPHGFELMAGRVPASACVADEMLSHMEKGSVLTPSRIDDKHFSGLMIEYLQSYLDFRERRKQQFLIPYRRRDFLAIFEHSGLIVVNTPRYYAAIAGKKGGVFKLVCKGQGKAFSDSGYICKTRYGHVLTSHWINPRSLVDVKDKTIDVSTVFTHVPPSRMSTKYMVMSRLIFSCLRSTKLALVAKKFLVNKIAYPSRRAPVKLHREITFDSMSFTVTDKLEKQGSIALKSLINMDECASRFVPSSKFFLDAELDIASRDLSERLKVLNKKGTLVDSRVLVGE